MYQLADTPKRWCANCGCVNSDHQCQRCGFSNIRSATDMLGILNSNNEYVQNNVYNVGISLPSGWGSEPFEPYVEYRNLLPAPEPQKTQAPGFFYTACSAALWAAAITIGLFLIGLVTLFVVAYTR